MRAHALRPRGRDILIGIVAGVALLGMTACGIHETRSDKGEKKVEITTPFAQLKVNTDVDPKETGLPLYPGARRAQDSKDDKSSANVNISSEMFGLKVVAMKFESDDPPEKILGFYRDKMKAFGGKFLECQQEGFVTYNKHDDDKELTCGKERHGDSVELKAGTPNLQHIVAVKPRGSGSEFALVYVSKRGKEGTL